MLKTFDIYISNPQNVLEYDSKPTFCYYESDGNPANSVYTQMNYLHIGSVSVQMPDLPYISKAQINKRMIAMLEAKLAKKRADFQQEVNRMMEQITKYQSIGWEEK